MAVAESTAWPPVQAEAFLLAGRLADRTSAPRDAEDFLRQAIKVALRHGVDATASEAASDLAYTVGYSQQQFEQGLIWAEIAEHLLDRVYAEGDPRRSGYLKGRAAIEASRGRYAEAERLFSERLEIERASGTSPSRQASTLSNLGFVKIQRGEFQEATALYSEALALRQQYLGEGHPLFANELRNLGAAYRLLGRFEEARRNDARALEIQRRALGPEDVQVALTLLELGNLADDLGARVDAVKHYQEALAIREKINGPESIEVARVLTNLAQTELALLDYERASSHLTRAHEIAESAGDMRLDVAVLRILAGIKHKRGELDEALTLQERAVRSFKEVVDADSPLFANLLEDLASLRAAQGQFEAADQLAQEASAIQERALGEEHPSVARCLNNRASILFGWGRLEESESVYRRVLSVRERGDDTAGAELASTYHGLGEIALTRGDAPAAIEHLERAVAGFERDDDTQTLSRIGASFLLARALMADRRDAARAVSLARDAADSLRAAARGLPPTAPSVKKLAEIEAWLKRHDPRETR